VYSVKFRYYKDLNHEWRWRLRSDNNEIIASGESYKNEADCLHAIALVKASSNAPIEKGTAKFMMPKAKL
jgi:uncharacterized protein YegP (UPF0339 family)